MLMLIETRRHEDFEISALTDYEMNDTWDGVLEETFESGKSGWTDEQRAGITGGLIENSDDWWEWLDRYDGFEPQESGNLYLWANQY